MFPRSNKYKCQACSIITVIACSPHIIMKFAFYTTLGLIAAAVTQAADNFYGLNYGVNEASCPNVDKLKQDFGAIQHYTNRVRTFALHVCNQGKEKRK